MRDVRFGSNSVITRCPPRVRFTPHSDRIADIARGRFGGQKQTHAAQQMMTLRTTQNLVDVVCRATEPFRVAWPLSLTSLTSRPLPSLRRVKLCI